MQNKIRILHVAQGVGDVKALLPSRWEEFGLVIQEYIILKKPVVVTAVYAIPNSILDGVNGLLVDVNNVEVACEAILKLKRNADLKN